MSETPFACNGVYFFINVVLLNVLMNTAFHKHAALSDMHLSKKLKLIGFST
jgi:hypothetical protein